MDDPGTLRRKAAEFFKNAASSTTPHEAEKLNEIGYQLELWADDLEEMLTQRRNGSIPARDDPGGDPIRT